MGITFTGCDMARRCYRIRLTTKVSEPWKREDFTYPDLLKLYKLDVVKLLQLYSPLIKVGLLLNN